VSLLFVTMNGTVLSVGSQTMEKIFTQLGRFPCTLTYGIEPAFIVNLKPRICWEIRPKSDQHREHVNIEIRGSGFSAKSSDFLPPKWSKNAGLGVYGIIYRYLIVIGFLQISWIASTFLFDDKEFFLRSRPEFLAGLLTYFLFRLRTFICTLQRLGNAIDNAAACLSSGFSLSVC
jgi:hypothetical protein